MATRKQAIIKEIDQATRKLNQEIARLDRERAWVNGYAQQAPSDAARIHLEPQEAAKFLSYVTEHRARLDKRRTVVDAELAALAKRKNELVEIRRVKNVFLLLSDAAGSLSFALSYVVSNASWQPSYDLRVDSANLTTVELTYNGVITNSTGDSWKNVRLSLSTAQPHVGGSPPALKTYYVRYRQDHQAFDGAPGGGGAPAAAFMMNNLSLGSSKNSSAVPRQNATSTTFEIPRATTIESDHQPHKVNISVVGLTGAFSYTTIPKLAEAAFLRSKTTNPTNYPFLAGKANVFMDSTFVASSTIRTTNPGEELSLYLGSDAAVVVEFKESLSRENKGLISKTLATKYLHEISVKNTKSAPIRADVFDQLPKSQDGSIKITPLRPKLEDKEKEGAAFLNPYNNVRWLVTIKPGESFKVAFEYQVEHPSDKEVQFT